MKLETVWRGLPLLSLGLLLGLAGCWMQPEADDGARTGESALGAEASADVNATLDPDAAMVALRAAYAGPPSSWPAFVVDEGVEARELGLVPDVVFPADNPYTEAKAELGELLFYDPRLSATRQVSCASCHDPDLGWADGRTVSFGTDRLELSRNAPTALGSGHFTKLFWDGRADSLEDLTLKVLANEEEMHGVGHDAAAKLSAVPEYVERFASVFGSPGIGSDRIVKAIATFVRTIEPGRSTFDRFVRQASADGRTDALSDQELRGLHLYRTRANCMNCHDGAMMSDDKLHVTGLHLYGRPDYDPGAFAVTGLEEDRGAFRTPHLRHIARTGPYMHHGLFESLAVTVRAYNGGMRVGMPRGRELDDPAFPVLSELLHPLGLSEAEVQDIVAFLGTLSEPHRRVAPPELPAGLFGRE